MKPIEARNAKFGDVQVEVLKLLYVQSKPWTTKLACYN